MPPPRARLPPLPRLELAHTVTFSFLDLLSLSTQLVDGKSVYGLPHGKLILCFAVTGTGIAVHLTWRRYLGIRVLEPPGSAQYGQLEMESLPPTQHSSPARPMKQTVKPGRFYASSGKSSAHDADKSVRLLCDGDHSASEGDDE